MAEYYKKKTESIYTDKTEELLKALPDFCTDYYTGRQMRLSPKSQYDYACKIKVFLEYLCTYHEHFTDKLIVDITLEDLALIYRTDIERFAAWLLKQPVRKNSSKDYGKNSRTTADNYLAILSSYWQYFIGKDQLTKNPIKGMDREKKQKKEIIYMEKDDRDTFLGAIWDGENLTHRQQQYRNKGNSAIRDACMMQILCDTGIRVSELVGLDLGDVDLKHHRLTVLRKGKDSESYVKFSDSTGKIIKEYLNERQSYRPIDSETALFLVSIGKYKGERISVRSVQNLVKKYAKASGIANYSRLSPHKCRSTYAMGMLEATGNISLVKEQLGHSRIETTTLYAEASKKAIEDSRNALF